MGGDATITLIATPGSQMMLWKQFFTLSANTETGAQRGCATCSLGDAQIQTAQHRPVCSTGLDWTPPEVPSSLEHSVAL